jgi:serine/threonine protein kinase
MTTGTIINLVTASQFQSNASFLCLDGGKVLAHLCEKNRPGEKTEAYTGLSLEALLPYIDHHVHLSLSGEYFQIMEFLGEGFESVVFKVHNHLSGGIFALKLGKLALEGNYRLLQPLLPTIKQAGISVPQYVSYDAHVNGILMEYSEGERFASFIEQMEQQKKKRFELFQMYAECLAKLITLQSTFHLSHGDAHEDNWLIAGDVPTLIDFRYSVTIPFTSQIYQYRDVFAMLCMLYRLVYGRHPENRPEVKRAIMQQRTDQTGHLDAFPPFHHGNRYDPLLHQFLRRAVYHPQAFTLQDIAHIVEIYRSGFPSE